MLRNKPPLLFIVLVMILLVGVVPITTAQQSSPAEDVRVVVFNHSPGSVQAQRDASANATARINSALLDNLGTRLADHLPNALDHQYYVSGVSAESAYLFGIIGISAGSGEQTEYEHNHGPTSLLFIAQELSDGQWFVTFEDEPGFYGRSLQAPANLFTDDMRAYSLTPDTDANSESARGDGSSRLGFPWGPGQAWTWTSGIHGEGAALDFAGGDGMVRASREGVAYYPCANFVRVDHPGEWRSTYYHLVNIQISNGQSVLRWQYLGDMSAQYNCGGGATGPHVHFRIEKGNNSYPPIAGVDLGGWTVHGTNRTDAYMISMIDGTRRNVGSLMNNSWHTGSGPVTVKSWEFSGSNRGWYRGARMNHNGYQNGGTVFAITGNDPYLYSPTFKNFPAANYPYMYLEMASTVDNCGQVYFRREQDGGFNESRRVAFTPNADGGTHIYPINLSSKGSWSGNIAQIRLDPACSPSGNPNTVRINRIWFGQAPTALGSLAVTQPYQGGVVLNWSTNAAPEWFGVYIGDGNYQYMEWHERQDICNTSITCSLQPPLYWPSGTYQVWMQAWWPDGSTEWIQGPDVVLPSDAPSVPQNINVNPRQGRPNLSWDDNMNAAWYEAVIVGNGQLFQKWYSSIDRCNGTRCNIGPWIDWSSGTYQVWMRAWGPGGFSDWVQAADLVLPSTPPNIPANLAVTGLNTSNPTFSWDFTANATWYELTIIPASNTWTYENWHLSYQIGCGNNGTCSVTDEALDGLLPAGEYEMWVRAWGPGGFSTGGSDGYAKRTFTYNGA